MSTVRSGPIPPYSNPPIEPQFYIPHKFEIESMVLGVTTFVTATEDMDYVIGQLVRLLIPFGFGCRDLNEKVGYVINITSADTVEIDLNSQSMTAFVNPNYGVGSVAQIVPVGDVNTGAINNEGRRNNKMYIPGSFRNISPL